MPLTAIQKMHYGSIKSNAFWDIAQFRPFICTQFLIQFCAQVVASSFRHISRTVYPRDLIQIACISVSKLFKMSLIWYSEKLHIFLYSAYNAEVNLASPMKTVSNLNKTWSTTVTVYATIPERNDRSLTESAAFAASSAVIIMPGP